MHIAPKLYSCPNVFSIFITANQQKTTRGYLYFSTHEALLYSSTIFRCRFGLCGRIFFTFTACTCVFFAISVLMVWPIVNTFYCYIAKINPSKKAYYVAMVVFNIHFFTAICRLTAVTYKTLTCTLWIQHKSSFKDLKTNLFNSMSHLKGIENCSSLFILPCLFEYLAWNL